MANGVFYTRTLTAATARDIYVNNYSDAAVVTVNICNRNHVSTQVRIAVSTLGIAGLTNAEYIEYDTELLGKGVLERTGIVVSPGQFISVRSSLDNVSAQTWGVEIGSLTGSTVLP